jgi:pimeloyl-ACP methyl ester carboxylesterase
VIDSGFTSMTETIHIHMPWVPAVAWLNRHPMDSLVAIRGAAKALPPTLVMVSKADHIVPTAMGEALAATIPGSTLFRSDWSGHPVIHGDPASREVLLRWLLGQGSSR